MRLICFATFAEAEATICHLKMRPLLKGELYEAKNSLAAITGFGSIAASSVTSRLLAQYPVQQVWNLGLAGAIGKNTEYGKIYPIGSVAKYPSFPPQINAHSKKVFEKHYPPLSLGLRGKNLVSCDYPLHQAPQQAFDLVDMEGYGVAFAALQAGVSCRLWKCVSDFCNAKGPGMIASGIQALSQQFVNCF